MTALIRWRFRPVPPPVVHRILNTPAGVARAVADVRRSGRLVSMTMPRPAGDGLVYVDITVLPARRRRHRSWRRRAVVAAVVTPVLAALVYAAAYAVAQLIEWLLANVLVVAGCLVLAGVALWLLSQRSTSGRHCPGAFHR